jgi:hypothetical protein
MVIIFIFTDTCFLMLFSIIEHIDIFTNIIHKHDDRIGIFLAYIKLSIGNNILLEDVFRLFLEDPFTNKL